MYKNAIISQFQCIFLLVLLCGCSSNSQTLGNDNVTTSMTTTDTSMVSSYVIKGHTSDHIATYKDMTYVMFDNYLYSIDQEFNIERVINIKDRIQDFLIDDDVIYFIGYRPNSEYNPGIFSMDMNTQQISYLYQLDKNGDIILINDCIWFVNNLAGYESYIEIITKDGRIVEL